MVIYLHIDESLYHQVQQNLYHLLHQVAIVIHQSTVATV